MIYPRGFNAFYGSDVPNGLCSTWQCGTANDLVHGLSGAARFPDSFSSCPLPCSEDSNMLPGDASSMAIASKESTARHRLLGSSQHVALSVPFRQRGRLHRQPHLSYSSSHYVKKWCSAPFQRSPRAREARVLRQRVLWQSC